MGKVLSAMFRPQLLPSSEFTQNAWLYQIGGIVDIITQGENGLLVALNDPIGFAKTVQILEYTWNALTTIKESYLY